MILITTFLYETVLTGTRAISFIKTNKNIRTFQAIGLINRLMVTLKILLLRFL